MENLKENINGGKKCYLYKKKLFFVQILEPHCALITFIIFLYAIVGVGWFICLD